MWVKAGSLEEALDTAEQMKVAGTADLFRGQTRPWPLLSSFVRRSAADRAAAIERFERFLGWLDQEPVLASIAADDAKAIAVAQHYGLPTNFVDFTTEPRIAAFFATEPLPDDDQEDVSCIFCLNFAELKQLWDAVRTVRPTMPELRLVVPDVPELWRMQAQAGVFIEYPFDESFARHTFDFDRIVFPTERDPARLNSLVPERDIYPSQKSDLEVLLDQFFMLERMERGSAAFEDLRREGAVHLVVPPPSQDGIESEVFGEHGLPVHASWQATRLDHWRQPAPETWIPVSSAPELLLERGDGGNLPASIRRSAAQIEEALDQRPDLRGGPVRWSLPDIAARDAPARALELAWDGLRRWPYTSRDLALGLAATLEYGLLVGRHPPARTNGEYARELATECFGEVIEVEVAMNDGSYARGFVSTDALEQAVRADFADFLNDRWRSQIRHVRHVLQVASSPSRAMVFDRLASLFCTQIVPTQVVLRDERSEKARLYNPARANRLGLP